jgi:hypothetical protein
MLLRALIAVLPRSINHLLLLLLPLLPPLLLPLLLLPLLLPPLLLPLLLLLLLPLLLQGQLPPRLFTVGRLDVATSGLIFLTNDGAQAALAYRTCFATAATSVAQHTFLGCRTMTLLLWCPHACHSELDSLPSWLPLLQLGGGVNWARSCCITMLLLLLWPAGDWANKVIHPSANILKVGFRCNGPDAVLVAVRDWLQQLDADHGVVHVA